MANLEKINGMSDNRIQEWLHTIDKDDLINVISDIDVETRNCIYRNMSKRAVYALQENIQKGAQKKNDEWNHSIKRLESKLDIV